MTSTQTPPKRPKEQIAQHTYGQFIPRASAKAARTEQPSAPRQSVGHSHGIQPEDSPSTTDDHTSRHTSATRSCVPQDEELELGPKRMPSSTQRYHTISMQEGTRIIPKHMGHSKALSTLIVGSSIGLGMLLATVVPYVWQHTSDQLTYGYPRTYQTDVNVGHYPTNKDKRSHFIAVNNHGYIEVIEVPEGVPGKEDVHLYLVSLPANAAADQLPVTLDFEDVNGNGRLDMEVSCNGNKTIFYNNGHEFVGKP